MTYPKPWPKDLTEVFSTSTFRGKSTSPFDQRGRVSPLMDHEENKMITKGDDYPIHQRPEPIAYSGTDRNFYDRYFFNGYAKEKEMFFAAALGVYPHLNIMDAAFCLIHEGVQHNIRASRHMNMERMDTTVGPISIDVMEPLKKLHIGLTHNESDIRANLQFTNRSPVIKEPRFTRRQGTRMFMDCTRMTQNGCYTGHIEVGTKKIEVKQDSWWGTRDRSWGIRQIGLPDSQPVIPQTAPQGYWIWAPANFDDHSTFFGINTDDTGVPWHSNAAIFTMNAGTMDNMKDAAIRIQFKSGTRHAKSGSLLLTNSAGHEIKILIEPIYQFYMSGLGYLHPEWGQGMYKGENAVQYDTIPLASVDKTNPLYQHIQAVSRFYMEDKEGLGVLEQIIIGPHQPSGFKDLLDMAP